MVISQPPGTCCVQGIRHDGESTGQRIKVSGRWEAYIATAVGDNARKDVALLLLPDVMGIWSNSELLADQFASRGYICMVVDTFNGDALTLNDLGKRDMVKWLREGSDGKNPHTPGAVEPIVHAAIETLRKEYGVKRVGAAGYCFGGKYAIRFLKSGAFDVSYVAHPTNITEEELSAIAGPLSIAAAEHDHLFPAEKRHEAEAILSKTGKKFQIFLYSGARHGFAVRGDMSDVNQRLDKEQALNQAVAWFDRHL